MVDFKLIGKITKREIIAKGRGIRELRALINRYGGKRWRKYKGYARIELPDGTVRFAEIHWYEADGVGKRDWKVKRYLD
jgi:hypothetical protein